MWTESADLSVNLTQPYPLASGRGVIERCSGFLLAGGSTIPSAGAQRTIGLVTAPPGQRLKKGSWLPNASTLQKRREFYHTHSLFEPIGRVRVGEELQLIHRFGQRSI